MSFNTAPTWSWPTTGFPAEPFQAPNHLPGDFGQAEEPVLQQENAAPEPTTAPPKARKHYPSRQCRICLEVVLPTFEPEPEGIAAMLNPTPRVVYISEDAESGRLIRPCRCKGSQKYVHEGCLQAWRYANNSQKNYWECPTCKFQYRLERLKWSLWIQSTLAQIFLTLTIFLVAIFIFGFIADPIINLYLDPYDTITSGGAGPALHIEDEEGTWAEHFLKGLASLGLLGVFKAFVTLGPWNWWQLRRTGLLGGGARRGNGRDRLEDLSWTVIVIGVLTFLYGVWKWVRLWSRSTLVKAGERVSDVQGNEDDEEDEEIKVEADTPAEPEIKKEQ